MWYKLDVSRRMFLVCCLFEGFGLFCFPFFRPLFFFFPHLSENILWSCSREIWSLAVPQLLSVDLNFLWCLLPYVPTAPDVTCVT